MGLIMAKESTLAALAMPDLFPQKKENRGRPKKEGALTNAQRQAKYRAARVGVAVGDTMPGTIKALSAEFDMTPAEVTKRLLQFALCNRNWRQTGFSNVTKKDKS